ncbi:MAG: FKBP-type peptidyl-prolyl cis-trans isomerase [Nitrospiria bacterium]
MFFRVMVMLMVGLFVPFAYAEEPLVLETQKDKVSYGIGLDIGTSFLRQGLDLDPKVLAAGIADAMTKREPRLSQEEIQKVLAAFQQEMRAKAEAGRKEVAEENLKEGESFLAENKNKEGVVTLSSGLQYKVVKKGSGETPKASDTVTTNYRGTLVDGTEFDSSYKRGEPTSFPVNGVIKGWTEALQLMTVGSKWELYVPSDLAYGLRGAGQSIGPNATLIFEIELLSID